MILKTIGLDEVTRGEQVGRKQVQGPMPQISLVTKPCQSDPRNIFYEHLLQELHASRGPICITSYVKGSSPVHKAMKGAYFAGFWPCFAAGPDYWSLYGNVTVTILIPNLIMSTFAFWKTTVASCLVDIKGQVLLTPSWAWLKPFPYLHLLPHHSFFTSYWPFFVPPLLWMWWPCLPK